MQQIVKGQGRPLQQEKYNKDYFIYEYKAYARNNRKCETASEAAIVVFSTQKKSN